MRRSASWARRRARRPRRSCVSSASRPFRASARKRLRSSTSARSSGHSWTSSARTTRSCEPTDDADAVHNMRVAVRRLRAVLRTARAMLERAWSAQPPSRARSFREAARRRSRPRRLMEHLADEASELGARTRHRGAARAAAIGARSSAGRPEGGAGRPAIFPPARPPRSRSRIAACVTRSDLTVEQLARERIRGASRPGEAHVAHRRQATAQAADPEQAGALCRRARSELPRRAGGTVREGEREASGRSR